MKSRIRVVIDCIFIMFFVSLLGGCYRVVNNQAVKSDGSSNEVVYKEIFVGDKKLRVEIADTPAKITKGLGYRDELGSNGMLFYMPNRAIPSFWMKGMRFPLDMLWIDCKGEQMANGKWQMAENNNTCVVVDISENVPVAIDPEDVYHLATVSPRVVVDKVLEVNAGWSKLNDVKIGDVVTFK